MKVRAVANGNVYDRADVPEEQIGPGLLFEEFEDDAPAEVSAPAPRAAALRTPEAPLENVANTVSHPVAPLTTESIQPEPTRARTKRRKR